MSQEVEGTPAYQRDLGGVPTQLGINGADSLHSSSNPIQASCLPFRGTKEAKTWENAMKTDKTVMRGERRCSVVCVGTPHSTSQRNPRPSWDGRTQKDGPGQG